MGLGMEVDQGGEGEDAWVSLQRAVASSDHSKARRLLSEANPGIVNRRNVFQTCLIHVASKQGDSQMVDLLLSFGADIDAIDYGGLRKTALHWAALSGHLQVVELLMSRLGTNNSSRMLMLMPHSGRSWDELLDRAERHHVHVELSDAEGLLRVPVSDHLVRMAIARPKWTHETHKLWPDSFKASIKCFLLLCQRKGLNSDIVCLVAQEAAYPLSPWV